MKQLTSILLACLFCMPLVSYAQKGFNFGLRVTPLVSFAKCDYQKKEIPLLKLKPRMGFAGGLALGYGFTENVGLESGLNVSLLGYTARDTITTKYRLTYVNLPILLKLRTNGLGGTGIHAKGYFGGTIGLKVGANAKTDLAFANLTKGENAIGERMQPLAAWFNFGLGVDWDLDGIGTIDLGVIYGLGLTNTLKQNYSYTDGTASTKPYKDQRAILSYVGLNIGFWFPTGK